MSLPPLVLPDFTGLSRNAAFHVWGLWIDEMKRAGHSENALEVASNSFRLPEMTLKDAREILEKHPPPGYVSPQTNSDSPSEDGSTPAPFSLELLALQVEHEQLKEELGLSREMLPEEKLAMLDKRRLCGTLMLLYPKGSPTAVNPPTPR